MQTTSRKKILEALQNRAYLPGLWDEQDNLIDSWTDYFKGCQHRKIKVFKTLNQATVFVKNYTAKYCGPVSISGKRYDKSLYKVKPVRFDPKKHYVEKE